MVNRQKVAPMRAGERRRSLFITQPTSNRRHQTESGRLFEIGPTHCPRRSTWFGRLLTGLLCTNDETNDRRRRDYRGRNRYASDRLVERIRRKRQRERIS